MAGKEPNHHEEAPKSIDLDALIRQYRDVEAEKEKVAKKESDIPTEMSSFILQHYDRVLILEKNEAAGEAAYRLLKAEGYNVEWETERDSAMETIENEKFSTLLVSEGFSADGLLIQDQMKKKGINVNLRIIKDFGTAILGHEETDTLKKIRRSFYRVTGFLIRFLESFHPPLVGHAEEVARLAREVAIRMELMPEEVDGVTIVAYFHELPELQERYKPFWDKTEDIFGDLEVNLPEWTVRELSTVLQYPFPITDNLKYMQERYDGKGYPDGLKGEQVPIGSRIIAPIDIYLTMTSGSEMGPTVSKGEAIDQLIMDSGIAFDPMVIEILVGILKSDLADEGAAEYRESILMVDTLGGDDLVKIQLREEGYQILLADGVQAALKVMNDDNPFMIVSEIDLNEGDGYQLLDLVRKRAETRDMPYTMMSARSDASFISKAIRAGADDFLPRPCPSDVMLAKIARTITRAKGHTTSLAERRGVTGNLKDLGILEIIQVLAAGTKNAMIIVTNTNEEARVALTDGRIVYAKMGELESENAFYKLISWIEGEFVLHMNVAPPKENIFIKNDMLLLEGFRRLDEGRKNPI